MHKRSMRAQRKCRPGQRYGLRGRRHGGSVCGEPYQRQDTIAAAQREPYRQHALHIPQHMDSQPAYLLDGRADESRLLPLLPLQQQDGQPTLLDSERPHRPEHRGCHAAGRRAGGPCVQRGTHQSGSGNQGSPHDEPPHHHPAGQPGNDRGEAQGGRPEGIGQRPHHESNSGHSQCPGQSQRQ